jgi:hypothetical protein
MSSTIAAQTPKLFCEFHIKPPHRDLCAQRLGQDSSMVLIVSGSNINRGKDRKFSFEAEKRWQQNRGKTRAWAALSAIQSPQANT